MFREKFIDRLEAFMKAEGLNANSLTVTVGLSNGLIGKALKTRGSMNSDSVERILCAYTHLNADWLMTGRGDMYVNNLSESESKISDMPNNNSLTFYLRDKVRDLEFEIRKVLAENASLKTRMELLNDSGVKTG